MSRQWIRGLAVVGTLGLVAAIGLRDLDIVQPIVESLRFPMSDKLAHFLLIGGITLPINLALGCRYYGYRWVLRGSVWVLALASAEELSQFWRVNRSANWADWLADLAGVLVFGWIALSIHRRQSRSAAIGK